MDMIQIIVRNFIKPLKFNFSRGFKLQLTVIALLIIVTETVHAQGCSVVLSINDPAPVCSPATIDLTSEAITTGSTEGLKFSYFTNKELTIPVLFPAKSVAGVYYIKGVLSGTCTGFAAASVTVTVIEKPKVIIPNPAVKSVNKIADLTLPQITAGSDVGLAFSYWYDAEAKRPILSPQSIGNGTYYIKGTSVNGCFDIKSITIND